MKEDWKTIQYIGVFTYFEKSELNQMKKDLNAFLMYELRICKKNEWHVLIKGTASIYNGDFVFNVPKITDRPGRPKIEQNPFSNSAFTNHHIHFMIKACPGEAFVKDMKNYWNRKANIGRFVIKKGYENGDIRHLHYMRRQGAFTRVLKDPSRIIYGFD